VIPRGDYYPTTTINITGLNDTWLHGVGAGTNIVNNITVTIFLHEDGDMENFEMSNMRFSSDEPDSIVDKLVNIRVAGDIQENIQIHHIVMKYPTANHTNGADNEYAPGVGIQLNGCNNCNIYKNTLVNFGWYPIEIENCKDTVVENNYIRTAYYGITGGSGSSRRNKLINNRILPATNVDGLSQGIIFDDCRGDWTISKNTIVNATGTAGINVGGALGIQDYDNIILEGNEIIHADYPITISNVLSANVYGNIVTDSQRDILFRNITNLSVYGNTFDADIVLTNVTHYSTKIPVIESINGTFTNLWADSIYSNSIYDMSKQGLGMSLNFNNGSVSGNDVFDSSGNSNHGLNNGATHNSTAGFNSGGAYKYDGTNDEIRIDDAILEDVTDDFSIEIWLKTNNDIQDHYFAGAREGDNDKWDMKLKTDYTVEFYGKDGGVTETLIRSDKALLSSDGWVYVVFVCENNVGTVYMDAVDHTHSSYTDCNESIFTVTNDATSSDIFSIGSRYPDDTPSSSNYFNGSIDEVRIWNRALSLDEIKRNSEQLIESPNSFVSQKDIKVNTTAIYPQNNLDFLGSYGISNIASFTATANLDIGAYEFEANTLTFDYTLGNITDSAGNTRIGGNATCTFIYSPDGSTRTDICNS